MERTKRVGIIDAFKALFSTDNNADELKEEEKSEIERLMNETKGLKSLENDVAGITSNKRSSSNFGSTLKVDEKEQKINESKEQNQNKEINNEDLVR